MSFADWIIRIFREVGPRFGPLVVVLILFAYGIYRWKKFRRIQKVVRNRLLSVIVVAGTIAIIWASIHAYRYGLPEHFRPGEIGILVAPIPGDERHAQQNTYIGAINALVSNDATLRDVVKVKPFSRELPDDPEQQHEEALRLGRRLGASFVIRPVQEEGGQRPWLTIVDQPEFAREEVALGRVTKAQLAELDKIPLPQDVALLARCALALSFYRRENYQLAATHFTQILTVANLHEAAPARPYLNFLLGSSYWYQRPADPASFLPLAIAAYEEALRGWPREPYPTDWAMTMNNRGAAYQELPGPDRGANLREAIRSHDLALEVYTRERYPNQWAMTMNNRGAAYQELPGPDRGANLKEAIRSYDQALEVRTRKRYPTEWAATMNNRGAAYWELPGPDRAANLREAIRSYDLALEVRTRERYPTDWAMTMNNRGAAYGGVPGPDRGANLREAIGCYEQAIVVWEQHGFTHYSALAQANLEEARQSLAELPGPK